MRTNYEALIAYLESRAEWLEDYETTHDDAGSNYHYLPEDGLDWERTLTAFTSHIREHLSEEFSGITDKTIGDVLARIRKFRLWEMVPGTIWGSSSEVTAFTLDSYSVGEIEDQICFEDLASEDHTFASSPFLKGMMRKAADDNRMCLRMGAADWCAYQYISTDAVWYAEISEQTILDTLAEVTEEKEQ